MRTVANAFITSCLLVSACSSDGDSGTDGAGTTGGASTGGSASGGKSGAVTGGTSSAVGGSNTSGGGGSSSATGGAGTGGTSATGGSTGSPAKGGSGGSGGASPGGGAGGLAGSSGAGGLAGSGGNAGHAGAGAGGSGGSAGSNGTGMSAGCGKSTTAPNANTQQTLSVSGATRYYLLNVPSGYSSSKPMPLVFLFHGRGMNNVWAAGSGSWSMASASGGAAILVSPQGSGDPPGNGEQFNLNSSWGNGDLAFFDALFADLTSKYCIELGRVFSTGFSMGGMFTNTLGCERSNVVRAIAPVAGWGPNGQPSGSSASCSRSMGSQAAMVFHSASDTTVQPSAGQASATFWRTDNGCTATTQSSSMYNGCLAYQGCRAGREAFFCSFNGGHTVPSGAGSNVWKFFNSLPLR